MSVTLELTLRVTYDANGVPTEELKDMLEQACVHHAMNRGGITGDTEAIVDDYRFNTEVISIDG